MRNFIIYLVVFCSFLLNNTFSQKLNYETTSPWFFGFNTGATWQSTDVKNKTHYGWGLVLGRSFLRNYGNPISFDVRLRYLGGAWRGQNTIISDFASYDNQTLSTDPTNYKDKLGFSLNNFQTKAHELNLELSLHLNRFTERTGWDPYIFGGIGITSYRTRGNLFDNHDSLYNYSASENYTKSSLKSLLDKDYESDLDGSHRGWHAGIMGHLGFGLGYYVIPNVAIGIEHKTTFSKTDLFDGVANSQGKFKSDIYHYTNLYLKVYLRKGRRHNDQSTQPPHTQNPQPETQNPPVNCDKPVIYISQPSSASSTSNTQVVNFQASVKNLGTGTLRLYVNNNENFNFNYNKTTGIIGTSIQLKEGQNTIQLIAKNDCGTTTQTVQIDYTRCVAPVIYLSTPQNSTVNQPSFTVNGGIQNYEGNGIYSTHNGVQTGNNRVNNNGEFQSSFQLQTGLNTIVLSVSNACGTDSKTIYVNYEPNCYSPIVQFKQPTSSSSSSTSSRTSYSSQISSLGNGTVQVYLNGQKTTNYVFNKNTGTLDGNIDLQEGNNSIQIIATNSCGSHTQTIQISYSQRCPTPLLNITAPSNLIGTANTITLEARIYNISDVNQVAVYVNGQIQSNGSYSSSNQFFRKNLTLRTGKNTVTIRVTNACGTNEESINYEVSQPCFDPSVNITNPSGARATTNQSTFTVQATIQNITNPQNITFKVNGIVKTNFNYSVQNGLFTATVQLEKGYNTIEISANNECGYASATANITYNAPCDKPVANWINPSTITTVSNENYTISSKILNINSSSDVQLKVNGVIQSSGAYNSSNNTFSKAIKLKQGVNSIQLIAQNNCGESLIETSITYKGTTVVPTKKPEITITSPCNVVVNFGMVNFSGSATGVANSSQITIKINDVVSNEVVYTKTATGFDFKVGKRFLFNKKVKLEVIASNLGGTTTQTCNVTTESVTIVDPEMVICHTVNGIKQTITIKSSQWLQYQLSGATEGPCKEVEDRDIQICLKRVTMTIKQSQWADYEKMGATMGACPEAVDNDIIICFNNTTMTIKESQWAQYKGRGATLGACPEKIDNDIIICVTEGRYKVTKTIKESQWPTYQAQGATLGECPMNDPDYVICVTINGVQQTKTIKQSQWHEYRLMGATIGACPEVVDQDITICLPGKVGVYTTLTIKQSQWPTYQAQGATLGACQTSSTNTNNSGSTGSLPDNKTMMICAKNSNGEYETIYINPSQWANYEKLGAVRGACKETPQSKTDANGKIITRPIRTPQTVSPSNSTINLGTIPKTPENKEGDTIKVNPSRRPTPTSGGR